MVTTMGDSQLTEVIARRKYFSPTEETLVAVVEIEKPKPVADVSDEFVCQFRIRRPNSEIVRSTHGIDELQALLLALSYIKSEMNILKTSIGAELRWLGGDVGEIGIEVPDIAK
jgi:hypothetical protein